MGKIIISGGTGFLGKNLVQFFKSNQHEVIVLGRGRSTEKDGIRYVQWDGKNQGSWAEELNDALAVINLAGKNINCRHNSANKKGILESRVYATQAIGAAINNCQKPPKVWVNASGISIYADSFDKLYTEKETDYADDFVAEVAIEWEKAVFQFELKETRQVAFRIGVVLGDDGALSILKKQAKYGLGGKHGSGNQIMPWIHLKDLIGAMNFVIENDSLQGVINGIGPKPVADREFMKALRKSMNKKIGLPAPTFAIKLGSLILGVESSLILSSKSVYPKKLIEAGYKYQFPDVQLALDDLNQ